MKQSFILFSSSPENVRAMREAAVGREYDVIISFDELSLLSSIRNARQKPRCLFFDAAGGEPGAGIARICAENGIPVCRYDPGGGTPDVLGRLRGLPCVGHAGGGTDGAAADRFLPGASDAMVEFKRRLALVAPSDIPVLLLGENGSGKTVAANAIHQLSARRARAFFPVNVAAFSEGLVESELFGSVEGAYTGARRRKGYFKSADKSTLFLDEIGELKGHLQAKLLTFLDSGEFRNVGSDETQRSDVRLICATNADVGSKVRRNEFREDFYYRIKGLELRVPPLRERRSDIPLLSALFLRKSGKTLSREAEELLGEYDWPGNIRQLHHCLECAVLFSQERRVIMPREIFF